MKKTVSLLLALVMVFAFAGCQGKQDEPGDYMALCERYGVSYGENQSEQSLPLTVKYVSSGGPAELQLSVYLDEPNGEGLWQPVWYQTETVDISESVTFQIPAGKAYRLMAEAMTGSNGNVQLDITTDPEKAVAGEKEYDSVLYDQGLEISALMSEMASNPDYLRTLTGSQEVLNVLSGAAAADPRAPKAVYEIVVSEDALMELLGVSSTEGMSEALKDNLIARSYAAVGPQINAVGGVNNLAASSMCTVGLSFVDPGFSGNALYLYAYEDGAPVLVSFSANQDHVVSASGCFILGDSIQAESKEEIRGYFAQFGTEVKEIQK